jgi:hypothetical protein
MNTSEGPTLRQLARAAGLSPAALNAAVECGLFLEDDPPTAWARELRRMRRLMDDLGVNAPGAALLVRMHRDLAVMQRQMQRLRQLEVRGFEEWDEGLWRDLLS